MEPEQAQRLSDRVPEERRDDGADLALRIFQTLCSNAQVFLVPSRQAVTQSVIDGYSRSSRKHIDQFVALTCVLVTNAYLRHCSHEGAVYVELCLSAFVRAFAASHGWNSIELQDERVYVTECKQMIMVRLCFGQFALHGNGGGVAETWTDLDTLSPP